MITQKQIDWLNANRGRRNCHSSKPRSKWMTDSIRQIKLFFLCFTAFVIFTVVGGLSKSQKESQNQSSQAPTRYYDDDNSGEMIRYTETRTTTAITVNGSFNGSFGSSAGNDLPQFDHSTPSVQEIDSYIYSIH